MLASRKNIMIGLFIACVVLVALFAYKVFSEHSSQETQSDVGTPIIDSNKVVKECKAILVVGARPLPFLERLYGKGEDRRIYVVCSNDLSKDDLEKVRKKSHYVYTLENINNYEAVNEQINLWQKGKVAFQQLIFGRGCTSKGVEGIKAALPEAASVPLGYELIENPIVYKKALEKASIGPQVSTLEHKIVGHCLLYYYSPKEKKVRKQVFEHRDHLQTFVVTKQIKDYVIEPLVDFDYATEIVLQNGQEVRSCVWKIGEKKQADGERVQMYTYQIERSSQAHKLVKDSVMALKACGIQNGGFRLFWSKNKAVPHASVACLSIEPLTTYFKQEEVNVALGKTIEPSKGEIQPASQAVFVMEQKDKTDVQGNEFVWLKEPFTSPCITDKGLNLTLSKGVMDANIEIVIPNVKQEDDKEFFSKVFASRPKIHPSLFVFDSSVKKYKPVNGRSLFSYLNKWVLNKWEGELSQNKL